MKGNWPLWVAVVGLCVGLLWSVDSCRDTRGKLKLEQAKYNQASELNTQLQAALDKQIADSIAIIKAREARIVALEGEAIVLTNKISHLTNSLSQANEPPTTAEIEALPIVQYLRARDKMQEERFSLAMAATAKDKQVIAELKGIVVDQDVIIGALTVKFNSEHSLRLASEELGSKKDARIRALEHGTIVKSVVVGAVVGTVTYLITK